MSEYILIILAFILSIALLSLIDAVLRVLKTKSFIKASLNLLFSFGLILTSLIIINWQTGIKILL
ncbi:hypothetical protein [Peribacillus aracenensis]|uniref:hypothetical protein n=1 Tax=Peribacillus aracenensis TaxID=2976708 RepID=UPI0021A72A5A|nr:hypothetical protein [Peribacillus sp. BBB004]